MSRLASSSSRSRSVLLVSLLSLGPIGLGVMAQGPGPTAPPPAAPQGVGPDRQGGPGAPAGAPGRQGGGGRGGRGGPQATDPANEGVDFSPRPPVLPLAPAEQLKHFVMQPGYRIELVLAEPHIDEPTAVAFDGNGRMFVLEDRGYMNDADGTGTLEPTGRISMHEDRDNDGVYEAHSVFVDNLVFPRFVMPFGANAVLTMESNADEVWKYTDTNNDGVSDRKELFATNFGRSGNVEHQQAFLHWGLDNWIYSTVNTFRVRWTPGGTLLRETTGSNGAQWGATHDNDGKMWFQGGASGVPSYFQFPIHYGALSNPDQFETDFRIPWGAPVRIADMQGGMPSVRMPDGSLNGVTGSAGNDIFRGHRLPADLQGDLLYGEPVARIVRRIKPVVTEGLTQLRNAYIGNEFIKSTDPLFRPVEMITAPDGTLYITDMYRGIIQESQWAQRGTYLRARIEQYGLDKVHSHGRIWRVTYDGMDRDRAQPRMLNETPAQLVAHLNHANGWWRDTAQQLIVLKQDRSVVPALQQLLRTGNLLTRVHALWTLEGLGAMDATLVRGLIKDPEPRMRIQAIRASETLYKAGDRSFAADYRAAAGDTNTDVALQALLTLKLFNVPDFATVVRATMAANGARGVQVIGQQLLQPPPAFGAGGRGAPTYTSAEVATLERGQTIYNELCFTCHAPDGRGAESEAGNGSLRAPSLASSPRVTGHRDLVVKTLLHGMMGPLDGRSYVEVMVPMGSNRDEWIADVASYVRNAFGNVGDFVSPADVARVRAATASRASMWTVDELTAGAPSLMAIDATWNATASHNAAAAENAFGFGGWSSATAQQAGMWFQFEMPQPMTITEIAFQSGGAGRGGGGGRGAAAPGPGGAPVNPAAMLGFPRGYSVQVSMDGTTWGAPVAQGQGTGSPTVITFSPVRAKFVRINQTATTESAPIWSIQRLRVYQAPAGAR
jgi:mono/diheme cytochrome c family protein